LQCWFTQICSSVLLFIIALFLERAWCFIWLSRSILPSRCSFPDPVIICDDNKSFLLLHLAWCFIWLRRIVFLCKCLHWLSSYLFWSVERYLHLACFRIWVKRVPVTSQQSARLSLLTRETDCNPSSSSWEHSWSINRKNSTYSYQNSSHIEIL
jgi:hypothetical protein